MNKNDNKRVAKNTLFLYFRMILIMLVTLYTSRVILAQLGISDYGIYNVVGGIVVMFSFLNSSMSGATQRYLTYELGKGDSESLKKVFAASLNIHIIIASAIVILAETIGLWFLNHKLNIPYERIVAANWVFQFAILTFCINIIQVPYNAVIIAHEKMNVYAYISILEVILKLAIAYLLSIVAMDKLIIYAGLVFIVQLFIRIVYQIYCRRNFAECKSKLFWDRNLYKEMTGFAGWNLFGSVAWLLRDQGVNILLNIFFGPAINAARGVAMQVSGAVMGFISNFQVALNPQITKNYAMGQIGDMEKLAFQGIKYSFILLFFLAYPLALNIDFVLNIWLEKVPDYSGYFIILILVDALAGTLFGGPLMTSLSATGKIRNYQIAVSFIILLIVPVSYTALKLGYNAPCVFYVGIMFTLFSGIARFWFCKRQIGFSSKGFFTKVLFPLSLYMVFSIPLPFIIKLYCLNESNWFTFLSLCAISTASTAIAAWNLCLSHNERQKLASMIKTKIKKV